MIKDIVIKIMDSCGTKGRTVFASAQNGKVDIPFYFELDNERKIFWVYAEEKTIENKIGRIEVYEGKPFAEFRRDSDSLSFLENVSFSGKYKICVTGVVSSSDSSKRLLTAYIDIDEKSQRKSATSETKEIEEAWEKAMALGKPFTEEFRKDVTEFFNMHGIDDDLRLRTISGYSLPIDDEGNPLELVKPQGRWLPTNTDNEKGLYFASYAETALEQILDGNPLIFEGPKSVGKNFLDEWLAYILGAVYYEISVDPDMVKAELYGDKVIDDASARKISRENAEAWLSYQNGDASAKAAAADHEYWKTMNESMRFVVENTEFKRWLRQKSGRRVLMVNEINYGNPTILAVVFNRVAEDRPVRFIDVPGEGRIYVGRDCILTASMNKDYIGTQELNEAMRSRFGVIEMQSSTSIAEILKDKIESEFGKNCLPNTYYTTCDKLYAYMLGRVSSKKGAAAQYGDKAISIRSFIRALRTVASKPVRRKKLLCAQLNLQLRGQCDTILERSSLTADINDICGEL